MVVTGRLDDEPRYTLAEATRILRRGDCEARGVHYLRPLLNRCSAEAERPAWVCGDCGTVFAECCP